MVTDRTKITKDGADATMQEIMADEQAHGQYWKKGPTARWKQRA